MRKAPGPVITAMNKQNGRRLTFGLRRLGEKDAAFPRRFDGQRRHVGKVKQVRFLQEICPNSATRALVACFLSSFRKRARRSASHTRLAASESLNHLR